MDPYGTNRISLRQGTITSLNYTCKVHSTLGYITYLILALQNQAAIETTVACYTTFKARGVQISGINFYPKWIFKIVAWSHSYYQIINTHSSLEIPLPSLWMSKHIAARVLMKENTAVPSHSSCVYRPSSHRAGPCSIPAQFKQDLSWIMWRWGSLFTDSFCYPLFSVIQPVLHAHFFNYHWRCIISITNSVVK